MAEALVPSAKNSLWTDGHVTIKLEKWIATNWRSFEYTHVLHQLNFYSDLRTKIGTVPIFTGNFWIINWIFFKLLKT